ncbi:transcription factor SPN1 KNAG_0A07800 [Huiozyma naganishii CBS 8797]|uniref:TFIIS N-terminal domain-containing protein n=1 Tax=Huiozyma naganishii (strain ATCC MYA-139 / BCRC 22969 / CBS 8797 / KCTC 17520 / NBRC 10181 / NCYC 3082 / Yp74L-3) TaxID=1071383 RepID=J7RUC9_HUIN7|nr:hypothetical protein KNAG_0A07800 [Kazachstania naganishii CBS 8797]CCK68432.1 hypothetical protein KNAG_0A07800 [Kazachstania naganishii CBS 8797]
MSEGANGDAVPESREEYSVNTAAAAVAAINGAIDGLEKTDGIDPATAETAHGDEEAPAVDSVARSETPVVENADTTEERPVVNTDAAESPVVEDTATTEETASREGTTPSVTPGETTTATQPGERSRKHIANGYGSDSDSDSGEDDGAASGRSGGTRVTGSQNAYDSDDNNVGGQQLTKRQQLEEKLDALLKKPKVRRTRRDEDDLEQFLDEKILRLKDEMNVAAQMDIDTLNKRIETGDSSQVAIQKVKLLPKVESILSKANLADTILDNNLLQSVRIWLEPLPDGSLPSFEIQKSLFAAIKDLPVKTEHLKESGLGRVMIFYTKSKRVEPQLARIAERLIAEWTRPIIGASDNYRDKRITQLEFDSEKLRKKSALNSAKRRKKQRTVEDGSADSGSTSQSLYEQAAARRNRAAAPAQTTTDYKYAPMSNVMAVGNNARSTGVGASLNNSDLYKRLNSRLNKKK